MSTAEVVTLIGILITLIISLINIIITRNKAIVDGITHNRMVWINDVRNVLSDILTFDPMLVIDKPEKKFDLDNLFRKNVNTLKLYLNFKGELDNEIISECNKLLDTLPNLTILNDGVVDSRLVPQFYLVQDNVLKLGQIYLKSEWTRVKYENRLFKPLKYWSPSTGFKEAKLIEDLTAAYDAIFALDDQRRLESMSRS